MPCSLVFREASFSISLLTIMLALSSFLTLDTFSISKPYFFYGLTAAMACRELLTEPPLPVFEMAAVELEDFCCAHRG